MAKTYSWTHRLLRQSVARMVATGAVQCARCGGFIRSDEPWDLGHVDGTSRYAGPEHRRCNRATNTPGRVTARNAGRRVSRAW